MRQTVDPSRLLAARQVVAELKGLDVSKQDLKELIEACLGLRVVRIQVSRRGAFFLTELARRNNIAATVGNYGLIVSPSSGLGDWSDEAGVHTDANDPRALLNVYLGESSEKTDAARYAEEELGDSAFGSVLEIPPCCRAFYSEVVAIVGTNGSLLPWYSVAAGPVHYEAPEAAVFFGRYFRGSLISHFPCTLLCGPTIELGKETLAAVNMVNEELARSLAQTHSWTYMIKKGCGIVAYERSERRNGMCSLSTPHYLGPAGDQADFSEIHFSDTAVTVIEPGRNPTTCDAANIRMIFPVEPL